MGLLNVGSLLVAYSFSICEFDHFKPSNAAAAFGSSARHHGPLCNVPVRHGGDITALLYVSHITVRTHPPTLAPRPYILVGRSAYMVITVRLDLAPIPIISNPW